jgi:carnitine O-acetyltransferase
MSHEIDNIMYFLLIGFLFFSLSKTLSIEMAKGEPMCMDSYKYMFNNCRMPKKPSDYEAIFDPVNNNHVVVLRKNKFYVVDTIHNGKQLSTNELQQQFQRIIDQAGSSKGLPIGVLTSDNRDKWTEVSLLAQL